MNNLLKFFSYFILGCNVEWHWLHGKSKWLHYKSILFRIWYVHQENSRRKFCWEQFVNFYVVTTAKSKKTWKRIMIIYLTFLKRKSVTFFVNLFEKVIFTKCVYFIKFLPMGLDWNEICNYSGSWCSIAVTSWHLSTLRWRYKKWYICENFDKFTNWRSGTCFLVQKKYTTNYLFS